MNIIRSNVFAYGELSLVQLLHGLLRHKTADASALLDDFLLDADIHAVAQCVRVTSVVPRQVLLVRAVGVGRSQSRPHALSQLDVCGCARTYVDAKRHVRSRARCVH